MEILSRLQRTYKELKQCLPDTLNQNRYSLQRTYKELKQEEDKNGKTQNDRLQRTYKELKHSSVWSVKVSDVLFVAYL